MKINTAVQEVASYHLRSISAGRVIMPASEHGIHFCIVTNKRTEEDGVIIVKLVELSTGIIFQLPEDTMCFTCPDAELKVGRVT